MSGISDASLGKHGTEPGDHEKRSLRAIYVYKLHPSGVPSLVFNSPDFPLRGVAFKLLHPATLSSFKLRANTVGDFLLGGVMGRCIIPHLVDGRSKIDDVHVEVAKRENIARVTFPP